MQPCREPWRRFLLASKRWCGHSHSVPLQLKERVASTGIEHCWNHQTWCLDFGTKQLWALVSMMSCSEREDWREGPDKSCLCKKQDQPLSVPFNSFFSAHRELFSVTNTSYWFSFYCRTREYGEFVFAFRLFQNTYIFDEKRRCIFPNGSDSCNINKSLC